MTRQGTKTKSVHGSWHPATQSVGDAVMLPAAACLQEAARDGCHLWSCLSDVMVSKTGAPQETVLSPLLFTIFKIKIQDCLYYHWPYVQYTINRWKYIIWCVSMQCVAAGLGVSVWEGLQGVKNCGDGSGSLPDPACINRVEVWLLLLTSDFQYHSESFHLQVLWWTTAYTLICFLFL